MSNICVNMPRFCNFHIFKIPDPFFKEQYWRDFLISHISVVSEVMFPHTF